MCLAKQNKRETDRQRQKRRISRNNSKGKYTAKEQFDTEQSDTHKSETHYGTDFRVTREFRYTRGNT